MTFTVGVPGVFDFTKCRRFTVRGMNQAKLHSQVSADVKSCTAFDPLLVIPNSVIDAVGEPTSTGISL